ncbi:single-stranded DNA-binding protein [Sphingobium sp. EM0848]|uniref:single-stranded DNA-binding protein n=1 Tax=Sphingobium sp. EM0848 TaxID=2743473 RepID=UPI00350FD1E2
MISVIKIASEPILDADHPAKGVNFARRSTISGSLHYSIWEDRDGKTRYGCEIIADKLDFF